MRHPLAVTIGAVLLYQAPCAFACSPGFETFLTRFESDATFQSHHTRYPLSYSHVDHSDPMMRRARLKVSRALAARYERFPTPQYQSQLGLKKHLAASAPAGCIVNVASPDSDMYLVRFVFVKSGRSWTMTEVHDDSL